MANTEAAKINIPKFFKDYNGGVDAFQKNLDNLKGLAITNPAAQARLDEINRSIIFINKNTGTSTHPIYEGEAIYANGKYYGAGSKVNIDSNGTINVEQTDDKTTLSTHSGIITIGDNIKENGKGDAFIVTNPVGNIEVGTEVTEDKMIYEVLKNMLQKTEYPKLGNSPKAKNNTIGGFVEVGDPVTRSLSGDFTDGYFNGALNESGMWNTNIKVLAGCIPGEYKYTCIRGKISSNQYTHTFTTATTDTITLSIPYSASTVIPKDSIGENTNLSYSAGTTTDSISITSSYKIYYGFAPYNYEGYHDNNNGADIPNLDEKLNSAGWYKTSIPVMESDEGPDKRTFVIVVPEGKGVIDSRDSSGNISTLDTWYKTKQKITRKGTQYCVWCVYVSKTGSVVKYTNIKIGDRNE